MHRRPIWIAIFVVLALMAVTLANCRSPRNPWEPTAASTSANGAKHP